MIKSGNPKTNLNLLFLLIFSSFSYYLLQNQTEVSERSVHAQSSQTVAAPISSFQTKFENVPVLQTTQLPALRSHSPATLSLSTSNTPKPYTATPFRSSSRCEATMAFAQNDGGAAGLVSRLALDLQQVWYKFYFRIFKGFI